MKKIILLVLVMIFAATNSFADVASGATGGITFGDGTTGQELHGDPTTATADTTLIGKASTNVGVGWNTSKGGYALVTQHKSGTKAYGTSFDSTSIFQTVSDETPGTVILDEPTATDTTDFAGTDWKAL